MSKGKGRGKGKTTSKSKAKVGRGKASLAKKVSAINACCPLIKWECKEVVVKRGKRSPSDAFVYDSGKAPADVMKARATMGTRCVIKYGKKTYKGLDPATKDDRINEIKKELASRRCEAVEAGM